MSRGYWLFDPDDPVNLMAPGVKASAEGGASFQSDPKAGWEAWLYFGSRDAGDVFAVSNTLPDQYSQKINAAIVSALQRIVQSGAVSVGEGTGGSEPGEEAGGDGLVHEGDGKKLDRDFSFLAFATENAGAGSQQDMLLALSMLHDAIPPDPAAAKKAFANLPQVQIPHGDNTMVGASDYFVFSTLAEHINESTKIDATASVSTDPVVLTVKGKHGGHDYTAKLSIDNGAGIGFELSTQFGLLSSDTWNIDVGGLVEFSVEEDSGVQELVGEITITRLSVTANQGSAAITAFEEFIAVTIWLMPPLALLCEMLFGLWRAILIAVIWSQVNKLNHKTKDYELTNLQRFELSDIVFEDGIVVDGNLYPFGAVVKEVSPTQGHVGDLVTISGQGFVDVSGNNLLASAQIGGQKVALQDADVSGSWDSGTARAAVPSGGTGVPTAVTVLAKSGWVSNAGADFTVLSTAAPSAVELGAATGAAGDSVPITGKNFTGATKVSFGTSEASFAVRSDTAIDAIVPVRLTPGVPVNVTVVNSQGSAESANQFTPVGAPAISAISGTGGKAQGAAGATITIEGENFIERQGAPMQAYFSRSPSGNAPTGAVACKIVSETQCTATVPEGATPGPVTVETVAGTSGGFAFTVLGSAAPEVKSFSPQEGTFGTVIAVKGSGFTGASDVKVGGQSGTFVLAGTDGDGTLSVNVPLHASTGPVSVMNSAGTGTSADSFEILPRPGITGISPQAGVAGSTVTIRGSGFQDSHGAGIVDSVGIATADAKFQVVSASQVDATVPSGVSGVPGFITVDTKGGSASSKQRFYVLSTAKPEIDGFKPARGPAKTKITVSGSNFTGTTAVSIDGKTCSFSVNSDAELEVTVSGQVPAGSYPIEVENSQGDATSSESFTVTSEVQARPRRYGLRVSMGPGGE